MVGQPSLADFKNMVKINLLPDSPVTVQDLNNVEFLFGPDVGTLKGKTTRKTLDPVRSKYFE
eukprot:10481632-Ditylum_brightwellii.AAC.1